MVRRICSICAGLNRVVPGGPERPRLASVEKWTLIRRQAKRSSTHTGTPSSEVLPAPNRLCAAPRPQRRSGSVQGLAHSGDSEPSWLPQRAIRERSSPYSCKHDDGLLNGIELVGRQNRIGGYMGAHQRRKVGGGLHPPPGRTGSRAAPSPGRKRMVIRSVAASRRDALVMLSARTCPGSAMRGAWLPPVHTPRARGLPLTRRTAASLPA